MDTPMSNAYGTSSASDTGMSSSTASGTCPTCGQSTSKGLEQFLGRLGLSDETIRQLKTSMEKVDVEEYLDSAREYLRSGTEKASNFTKQNPGKVAAGVAVLAVGAGLLISALNRE